MSVNNNEILRSNYWCLY